VVDHDVRMENTIPADLGVAADHAVGTDSGVFSDHCARIDYSIRANSNPCTEGDSFADHGSGMHMRRPSRIWVEVCKNCTQRRVGVIHDDSRDACRHVGLELRRYQIGYRTGIGHEPRVPLRR
jgi:hypothetical protein